MAVATIATELVFDIQQTIDGTMGLIAQIMIGVIRADAKVNQESARHKYRRQHDNQEYPGDNLSGDASVDGAGVCSGGGAWICHVALLDVLACLRAGSFSASGFRFTISQ